MPGVPAPPAPAPAAPAPAPTHPPKPLDPEPSHEPIDPEKGRVQTPEPGKPEHPSNKRAVRAAR